MLMCSKSSDAFPPLAMFWCILVKSSNIYLSILELELEEAKTHLPFNLSCSVREEEVIGKSSSRKKWSRWRT